ncbi:MAG: cyclic nucleotide-binding domain-containing protein [Myxococcota bacterium]
MDPNTSYLSWAVAIGAISAVSLPLGSIAGLVLRPRAGITAVLAAFGAGALIAALTVELVAPSVEALGHDPGAVPAFFALALGAIAGGLIFVTLDSLLAIRGGFLRKVSTTLSHAAQRRQTRDAEWLHDLCAIPLLRALPAEQVGLLVRDVSAETFSAGDDLFREGDLATRLLFVRRGDVELSRGGSPLQRIGSGGILGELALVANVPHRTSALAATEGEALVLGRKAFERWRTLCPEFDAGVRELATDRLEEVRQRDAVIGAEEEQWARAAISALRTGSSVPTPAEVRRMADEHPGAGLAVWLGMLIDGIPESIVIGAGFVGLLTARLAAGDTLGFAEAIPYTLVAGLFLSNFPEALSSSIAMRQQGWQAGSIVGLWSLLMAVTAIGAGVGFLIGESLPHVAVAGVEGIAAGAMLTAIAATMLPEAVHLSGSGSRVGLGTLFGFLSAISFKLLE